MTNNTTVSTFLWFDSNANEAAELYCSIVPRSKVLSATPGGATFELDGQRFIAFNGGPTYQLTPAVSVFLACDTQAEIDALWDRFLAAGGTAHKCGWLVDKYGLSWQVVPRALQELLNDPDRARANRVVQAMLGMVKLDLAALQAA